MWYSKEIAIFFEYMICKYINKNIYISISYDSNKFMVWDIYGMRHAVI